MTLRLPCSCLVVALQLPCSYLAVTLQPWCAVTLQSPRKYLAVTLQLPCSPGAHIVFPAQVPPIHAACIRDAALTLAAMRPSRRWWSMSATSSWPGAAAGKGGCVRVCVCPGHAPMYTRMRAKDVRAHTWRAARCSAVLSSKSPHPDVLALHSLLAAATQASVGGRSGDRWAAGGGRCWCRAYQGEEL